MPDPIEDIIGDYRTFAAQQRDRLRARGIDIAPYALAPPRVPRPRVGPVRAGPDAPGAPRHRQSRELLERPPISLIVPAPPLEVLEGKVVPLIELIPPVQACSTRWDWSTSASSSATRSTRSSKPTSPS